ncbi:hypothetical protein CBS101457_005621 [Exobasidium rhododendri]|nr:hypothetical protein CBS101457_005621 [Exobasidium rhododendri]
MFFSAVLRTSRTTYRGASGSGAGASSKTSSRSSPASRSTLAPSVLAGRNFKRSQRGLFDGALPQSGNTIPKSLQKTARSWRPNIQIASLKSDILSQTFKLKVTSRALRTIRKFGGLDEYMAKRDGEVLGKLGREVRNHIGLKVRLNNMTQKTPLVERNFVKDALKQRLHSKENAYAIKSEERKARRFPLAA